MLWILLSCSGPDTEQPEPDTEDSEPVGLDSEPVDSDPVELPCEERDEHHGDIYVDTEEELRQFGRRYRAVNGEVYIQGLDVEDLGPLSCLDTVEHLELRDNAQLVGISLPALSQLEALTIVGSPRGELDLGELRKAESIALYGLPMEDLQALSGLTELWELKLLEAPQLSSLAGLEISLLSLELRELPALTSLESMELSGITNVVHVYGLPLKDLSGLEGYGHAGLRIELAGLEELESLEGTPSDFSTLDLQNLPISDLEGLSWGDEDSSVWLSHMPALSSLAPISESYAIGDLLIEDTALVRLDELNWGRTGSLLIRDNDALEAIEWSRLELCTGSVDIRDNPALASILAPKLEEVASLTLLGLPTSTLELTALSLVHDDLRLEDTQFTSVRGLAGVQQCDDLVIDDNPRLQSVTDMVALNKVHDLSVRNNPNLPTSDVEALRDQLEFIDGEVEISGNAE